MKNICPRTSNRVCLEVNNSTANIIFSSEKPTSQNTLKLLTMRIPTILFLLIFSNFSIAQDVLLFEDTKTETLVFSETNIGNSSTYLKQILQVLNPHNGYHASFDLYYEYRCRLTEKENFLEGKLTFDALKISREPQFKGFYFTEVLYPVSAKLTFDLLANDAVVYSMTESIPLTNLSQAILSFNFDDIQPSTYYTLNIKGLKFNYNGAQLRAANRRKSAIDQYYVAKSDLNEITKALNSLEDYQVDPDYIDKLNTDINNWATEFDKIDKASFWTTLPLKGSNINDPEQLNGLRNEVSNSLDNTKGWIKELMANIHELYYQKGVELFDNKQIGSAKNAFQKSINAKRHYPPSHHFLAVIDFGEGHIDDAADRTHKILNDYRPDSQTRQASEALARDIIRIHFDTGQKAVDAGNYPEGVEMFQHALAFSESIRGFQYGQEEAISRINEAYYQDFHSQLDEVIYLKRHGEHEQALAKIEQALAFQAQFQVASTYDTYALHNDIIYEIFEDKRTVIFNLSQTQSWDKAMTTIQLTDQFISDYKDFFKDQRSYQDLKMKIFNGKHQSFSQLATDRKKEGKLDSALEEATLAANFSREYHLSKATQEESDKQVQFIQEARYQRFVQGGDHAHHQQDFQAALNQYDAALDLEKRLTYLPISSELDLKTKGTALQEIKRQYQEVMIQSAVDNQQIARVFGHIQDLSGRYHLTLEPEVKEIYQQLENQQCHNAKQILMPALEKDLVHFQTIKDFQNALKTIDKIKVLLATYSDCDLSDTVVKKQAKGIELCASYQGILEVAKLTESQQRYRASLDHFLRAKDLYQNALVANQLAAHPAFNMYTYILNHSDNGMLMAGANLYLDQRKHEEALSLLKALIAKGIPPKRTEHLQDRLGSALAVKHFVSSANWKVVFADFISKNEQKKFKDLKQAFRKQWRRMG